MLSFSQFSFSCNIVFPLHLFLSRVTVPQTLLVPVCCWSFSLTSFHHNRLRHHDLYHLSAPTFAFTLAAAYLTHGLILSILTGIITRFLEKEEQVKETPFKIWLRHRINIACHLRFAKLLSGNETFCVYLRLLGAKVGSH